MTYNPRRSILGAISVEEKISYHLFKIDVNPSAVDETVILCRKTGWSQYYSTFNSNLALFIS